MTDAAARVRPAARQIDYRNGTTRKIRRRSMSVPYAGREERGMIIHDYYIKRRFQQRICAADERL